MGYHESAAAHKDKTLTGSDRLADFVIANLVNEPNGYELWASLDWLAEGINSSRATARRSLRRLVDKGCLEPLEAAAGRRPAKWRWIHPDNRRGITLLPLVDPVEVADHAPQGLQITRVEVPDRATVPIYKRKKEKDLKESAPQLLSDDIHATATEIIEWVYAHRRPKPTTPKSTAEKNALVLLEAGHDPADLAAAMMDALTLSKPSIEVSLGKRAAVNNRVNHNADLIDAVVGAMTTNTHRDVLDVREIGGAP